MSPAAAAQVVLPPLSEPRNVDFGPGIGMCTAYLYNLPEVPPGCRV